MKYSIVPCRPDTVPPNTLVLNTVTSDVMASNLTKAESMPQEMVETVDPGVPFNEDELRVLEGIFDK